MPGFTTHYLFGVNTYKALENTDIKKMISAHHTTFSLGLQGPDIFFYYLPSYAIHKNNIGSVAHREETGTFLCHLIESCNLFPEPEERNIAHAYIMGFIGHYLLDRRCHPYVYFRTHYHGPAPEYHAKHMTLETDIDRELLDFYKHKQPSEFSQKATISLSSTESRVVATILCYAYSLTYPDLNISYHSMRQAIIWMQKGVALLRNPHEQKKVLTRKIESLLAGRPLISPMIPSDNLQFFCDPLNLLHKKWHNPWKTEFTSTESFFDLMEKSKEDYLTVLPWLYHLFLMPRHLNSAKTKKQHILEFLGNCSYHSGLTPEEEVTHF